MFYVNDDDIEGLFRKAAENYDINAENASDWDRVLKALNEDDSSEDQKPEKKKRRFLIFWWFLLLPLAGLLLWNKQIFTNNGKTGPATEKQTAAAETVTQKSATGPVENSIAGTGKDINTKSDDAPVRKLKQNIVNNDANKAGIKAKEQQVNSNPDLSKLLNNSEQQKNETIVSGRTTNNDNAPLKNDIQNKIENNNELIQQTPDEIAGSGTKQNEPANQKNIETVATKKETKKIQNKKSSFFYAGLSGAIDVSFIKFQKTTSPGITAGLVTGFRFNKWQAETGILFAKKNYYTSGEYFDKSSLPYPGWDLQSVTGYCNMLEIPLNLRFNFGEKAKHSWFVSTGISSYLMNKEYYTYGYFYNTDYYERDYTYMKSSKDWCAVMNMSAGYELKAGAKSYIRFEPYYKLPLKGIGTGNLPLSSAGINVAITRQIP